MSAVDPVRLAALLGPATRWTRLETVAQTGSTNDDVLARAEAGEPEGLVLVAAHQTGGHGRFDRVWLDEPGAGVALSVLLRPSRPLAGWGWLPLLTGMAVVRGLREACPVLDGRLGLKWPNDVLVDGAKCCGILAASDLRAAVVGIGINLAQTADQLPAGATSLAMAGAQAGVTAVVAAVLAQLDALVARWEAGESLRGEYRDVSDTLGRDVRVQISARTGVEGRAVDIAEDGALVVELPDGSERSFAAGDVVHLRPQA